MELKKEHEVVQSVQVIITSVDVITNPRRPEEVSKIVFTTNKGGISYKPTTQREIFRDGLKVKSSEMCKVEEIPEKVKEIGREIQIKGKCIVEAYYSIWNTEHNGSPVTYKFIQGNSMLNKWAIQKDEVVS